VRVCLDRHHSESQSSGQSDCVSIFQIAKNGELHPARANWMTPESRTKNAWRHKENEATDRGACAIALAALELNTNLVSLMPAIHGSGADYIAGLPAKDLFAYWASFDGDPDELENAYRIEISGVGSGDEKVLIARLKDKMRQLVSGTSNLPAIAIIVGFNVLKVFIADVVPE